MIFFFFDNESLVIFMNRLKAMHWRQGKNTKFIKVGLRE